MEGIDWWCADAPRLLKPRVIGIFPRHAEAGGVDTLCEWWCGLRSAMRTELVVWEAVPSKADADS